MPHLSAEALRQDPAGTARLAAVIDSDPRCRAMRALVMARLAEEGGVSRRSAAHFGLSVGYGLGFLLALAIIAVRLGALPGFA